jgi:enoyl-CoA hydratase
MAVVETERRGDVLVVRMNRPHRRNAVDTEAAEALLDAFTTFDASDAKVAVLTGDTTSFCAGADLKEPPRLRPSGPLGPTRLQIQKPTIAAVEGWAVAGGLELACMCDLRVAGRSARFGCLERRWGVPLMDGGTYRLPRIVGLGRALDLILTGREIDAQEAYEIGLVQRVVDDGTALDGAVALGEKIASFPWLCVVSDRLCVYEGLGEPVEAALANEDRRGTEVVLTPGFVDGITPFLEGQR